MESIMNTKFALLATIMATNFIKSQSSVYGPTAKSVDPTQRKLQYNCGAQNSKHVFETNGQINIESDPNYVNDLCDADPNSLGLNCRIAEK